MGQIALIVPSVGSPRGSAESSINSDLNTIQTVINGNIDDSNLKSPDGAVRRVMLQASGYFAAFFGVGNYPLGANQVITPGIQGNPQLWVPDVGLDGHPPDFQVANKTAFGQVRACFGFNAVAVGVVPTVWLYQVTSVTGTGSNTDWGGTRVVGSGTSNAINPLPGFTVGTESAPFTLPGGTANTAYFLVVEINLPIAAGSAFSVTAQLLGYNA